MDREPTAIELGGDLPLVVVDVLAVRALARHEAGQATVVPVMLRPCDWKNALFAKLQALPKDAVPVTRWTDPEDAWVDVAQGIRRLIVGPA